MVLPCFAGIANSILGRIVERIEREVSHLVNYSSNVEELRSAAKDLSDGIKSIEEQIAEADNSGLSVVDSVVKGWQEKATSLDKEAAGIIRDEDHSASSTCLLGLRFNLWACYLTSKKSIAAKDKAVKLREEAKTFVRIASIDHSHSLSIKPSADFDAFKSRDIVSNNIYEALKNPNVHMVGVHGMGGLGKTTLVEKVSEQLYKDGTFKHVVMAHVSQKPDLHKIQQEIADQLRFKLDATTDKERARQLMEKLEKREKLLIVLDDIWNVLEFNLIGIPFRNRLDQVKDVRIKVGKEANPHQTSSQTWYPKILMTSRNVSLLKNEMGSTCNFELQILSYDDAWNLFHNTWRMTTAGIPDECLSIASEVVNKCSGLPILLVIVAKALRTGDLSIWRDALRQLESFEFDDSDEVYKKIELSYNYLKSDEIKSLFRLFGQLDPHFTPFSDLLKYTAGLSLFKGCMRLEQVRDRLHKCLNDLKAYGLLHDVEYNEEAVVRMHDVVHKFAVFVGGRDHHMLTFANGVKIEEWPGDDDLEAIALPYCHLPLELPASFHGPKLTSFKMHRMEGDHPLEIPDYFFVGMKGLKLMDLATMVLSPVLPSSLTALVKLQTLCLYYCELDNIALIGELPRLQVLSLQGSSILRLPNEIGKLGQLKLLDLNNCTKLKEIASDHVLSKLTSLEELCMENSFKYWEKEGYSSSTNAIFKNASLGELKNLPNLISLDIHIPHAEMFPKDLFAFEKLERFFILIGDALDWRNRDFRNSRTLKLKFAESPNQLGYGGIKALMERAEDVYLQQHNGFESLCELHSHGFPHLKHLNVQKVQIQYVVNSISSCVVFPKLESLVLKNLTTLQKIICRATAAESWFSCFQNLQSLIIDGCEKITYLFISPMIKSLAQLKRLEVSDCESLKEIVFTGGTSEEIVSGEDILFPNLNIIQLKSLQKLRRFCNISNLIEFPSLAHLFIEDCSELCTFTGMDANEALFDETVAFPNLEELKITKMGGLKMIWGDALHPTSFFKLKTLGIKKGSALLSVFSAAMASRALNLESLIISECESLIEVFDVKMLVSENKLQGEVQETQLKTLHISNLPKLKHLWNEDTHGLVSFQNLESVSIKECPSLTSLFPISVALGLHQLEELTIVGCEGMKDIVSNKEDILPPKFVFANVNLLKLWTLPELDRFYPGSHTSEWPMLKNLFLYHCDKIDLFGTKFQSIQGKVRKNEEPLRTQVSQQPFLCFTKIMPNLNVARIRGMDMEMIQDNASLFVAEKVKAIDVHCFHDDSQAFPLELLQRFRNFDCLTVACSGFNQLFPSELLANEANVKTLARIVNLSILALNEMTQIWGGEFDELNQVLQNLEYLSVSQCYHLINLAPSNALFSNLTYLVVTGCKQLVQLITSSSTIKSLANLTEMTIRECDLLTDIVASDHGYEATSNIKDTIVFPKLEKLTLQVLASLTSFCSAADCNFLFPSLVTITVAECPEMKVFCKGALSTPMLIRLWVKPVDEEDEEEEWRWEGDLNSTVRQFYKETVISHQRLTLSSDPMLQDIWHDELPAELFSALRFLEVVECTFVTYAISSSLLRSLNNLKELRVTNNKFLKEVFDGSLELDSTNGENVLSELREFYLVDSPRLMHVCPENFEGVIVFKNLTLIDICNCSSLRYVFTASMALCLVHIQVIQVKSCAGMEAIIVNKKNDDNNPMILPQLTSLLLESLPCLSRFYSGNGVLESPNLGKITIIGCPEMDTFTSPAREKRQDIFFLTCGIKKFIFSDKGLFTDKVGFPNLEELKITKMGGLEKIWGDALHPSSFSKLKTLVIKQGYGLASVFSSGMVGRTLNLESLIISQCYELKEVFDMKTLMSENKLQGEVQETQLKTLHVSDLRNLKHLWTEDPHGLISFQNLESVSVKECPSLTRIFPISVALGLHQLKELIIDDCGEMEEIVSSKKDIFLPKFLFPNVTSLKVWRSAKLKRFYSGPHTSEWPILNNLSIQHCDKIDLFGTKFQSIRGEVCKDQGQLHTQVNQQPFLCLTKIMQNLEAVTLRGMDVKMIYDNDTLFLADKVKVIYLQSFHDDSQVFPLELLHRFQNLNRLFVWLSAFKQLFPSEILVDEANVKTLARIPHLIIEGLNEMTYIWGGEFHELNRVLQNLEYLSVRTCNLLISLAPSNALFPNLTYLTVTRCKQLVQLITSSTAKSLSNLTQMKISECDSMTEIVSSDHGDEDSSNIKDTIVFRKLKRLTLQCLASLTSFCSAGDCNFMFPCLVTIIVAECPKMKHFCRGALRTPMLIRVWVKPDCEEDKELHWEGDINSTLKKLYIETVISHQRLTLSSDPVLQDIWHSELPVELFSALRFLEVVDCTFVTYAISSSLLRSLINLEELRITNNKSLEEVFDGSVELDSTNGENILSELRKFYLTDLPSLMHVCPETLVFKNLTHMTIYNCSSLRYVFTTSMALCLVHIRMIEVRSCADMETIILNKENDDNIVMILPQLWSLYLVSLHCLSSFYSGNGVLESPNLDYINIDDCPKMETFTSASTSTLSTLKGLFNDKVALPNLKELDITKMGGLKVIWGEALHPRSFSKLRRLGIEKGSALLSVFSSAMVSRTINLERLIISECESLIEIFDVKMLTREKNYAKQRCELKTLEISKLPKLKHLWNEDPRGLVSFQNLESVSVEECPSLTSLFPISVALGLHQLKKLIIGNCEGMKEIVSEKEDISPPKFVFPKVTYLKLWESPELKCFYPGSHTLEWPLLNHGDEIYLFGTKNQIIKGEDEEQRSFFW